MTTTNDILREVLSERVGQDAKWGAQVHDFTITMWMTILVEEVGEACQATLRNRLCADGGSFADIRRELVQVAAVAVAVIEQIDNGRAKVIHE